MAARPARHRLDLTCPLCGHVQSEPALAVSSVCRGCGVNFKIEGGKAVAAPRQASAFTRVRKVEEAEDAPTHLELRTPSVPFQRPAAPVPPPVHPLLRWFVRPPKPRDVSCFECGRRFTAAPGAQSSQCPACGRYVSLRDYEIAERWNGRIHTRGDVVILKSGALTGVPASCHNLTAFGELGAPVECTGELVLHGKGRIPGQVRCRTLRVERGAKIEFAHTVHAEEVILRGQVTGHLHCTGTVTLEKRAVLNGLIQAARVVMNKGARHNGSMEILSPERPAGEDG